AGARDDLPADHGLRRAAAGVPQHAAGAADADHHPVPGHLAGLRALDHRLHGRRLEDRAARRPPGRDVPVRGAGLFFDLVLRVVPGTAAAEPGRDHSLRTAMITLSKVSKWYQKFQVLTNCSTEVAKGEVVVVCGPSGSGKSTLIKCVNGLEPFQEGTITVDGISVGDPKTDLPKLRARIGMVFQHFELFP